MAGTNQQFDVVEVGVGGGVGVPLSITWPDAALVSSDWNSLASRTISGAHKA